jgi:hypothetical protein
LELRWRGEAVDRSATLVEGDEEVAGCWCSAAARGSFVASMLMRETVACGRWRREDLSAAGWKAVFSVAERSTARRGKVWCVGGVRVCCWKRKMELLSWRRGEAVAEGGRESGWKRGWFPWLIKMTGGSGQARRKIKIKKVRGGRRRLLRVREKKEFSF